MMENLGTFSIKYAYNNWNSLMENAGIVDPVRANKCQFDAVRI